MTSDAAVEPTSADLEGLAHMTAGVATRHVDPQDHLPLVYHIVKRVAKNFPTFMDRDDLVQAGMVGLVEAANRFDPECGVAFASFAGRRIEGAIYDHVRADSWMPRSVRELAKQLRDAEDNLSKIGSYTDEDIAAHLQVSPGEVHRMRTAVSQADVCSMDAGTPSSTVPLGDTLQGTMPSPEEVSVNDELGRFVRAAVEILPERQRYVLVRYYIDDVPLADIAAELGVGVSRVSKIKQEAIDKVAYGVLGQYKESVSEPRNSFERSVQEYTKRVALHANSLS